jgi:hypothetical protein
MAKFKPGDRVICIKNNAYEDRMFIGKMYTVKCDDKESSELVIIKELEHFQGLYRWRFRKATKVAARFYGFSEKSRGKR